MALLPGHRANFDTLLRAALAGDLALLDCRNIASGEPVPVLCAANRLTDGNTEFVPLASLFCANPYDLVVPLGADEPDPPQPENPRHG